MRPSILVIAAFLTCDSAALAGELYATAFEAFPVGDNLWAGTEGWLSNDVTSGAQGILGNIIPDLPLGKTAYLGFEPPEPANQGFTTVFRPVNYDPVIGGFPCLEFDSLLGIQDSTLLNGQRDAFFISFYNLNSDFLAAIEFDNASGAVFRCDGVAVPVDTGVPFLPGNQEFGPLSLQLFYARIDLVENTWSAFLDGVSLFIDAPFTATGDSLTIGAIAAEWLLSSKPQPGDNWMLVADWAVRSAPKGIEPFGIDRIARNEAGETTLRWIGEPGFDYAVRWTGDLQTWHSDLPNSSFPGIGTTGTLSFTDVDLIAPLRFYQVVRTPSP